MLRSQSGIEIIESRSEIALSTPELRCTSSPEVDRGAYDRAEGIALGVIEVQVGRGNVHQLASDRAFSVVPIENLVRRDEAARPILVLEFRSLMVKYQPVDKYWSVSHLLFCWSRC